MLKYLNLVRRRSYILSSSLNSSKLLFFFSFSFFLPGRSGLLSRHSMRAYSTALSCVLVRSTISASRDVGLYNLPFSFVSSSVTQTQVKPCYTRLQVLNLRLRPASQVPAFTQTLPDFVGLSWNVATNSSKACNIQNIINKMNLSNSTYHQYYSTLEQ